jgi:putative ABC transport system permease protein
MKYLFFIASNLMRRKTRACLTFLSIVSAFTLFGLLQPVRTAFIGGTDTPLARRLVVSSKYSLAEPLPQTLESEIKRVPNVSAIAFATFFLARYRDRPVHFAVYSVVPDDYLKVVPQIDLPASALAAWKADRTGAVVETTLARRMGWQVGDRIALESEMWPRTDGTTTWTFNLVGTYQSKLDNGGKSGGLLFRHDYFDETRQYGRGTVGWFYVRLAAPEAAESVERRIDGLFANSSHETKTQAESAFARGLARQFGDIGLIIGAILGASFFSLLLITGNTAALGVRERIPELGTLKALGFTDSTVCLLIFAESLALAVCGCAVGLALAAGLLHVLGGMLAAYGVPPLTLPVALQALALAVGLASFAGMPPAWRALRIRTVDALRA